jgi:hypothetical protein
MRRPVSPSTSTTADPSTLDLREASVVAVSVDGTDLFARSASYEIDDGVTCVVVRGHDQTHGYGGRAMLIQLETSTRTAVGRGSETGSVSRSDCP